MQEENALIGVQIAAYYPDISLSTVGGFVGTPLTQLFRTSNEIWSLGASASQTLFEGGLRSALWPRRGPPTTGRWRRIGRPC